MPKVKYDGITFDSDLEVEYYKYLKEKQANDEIKAFFYHPQNPIQITRNNYYTPDFVVFYFGTIEIVETKGYNPYSKMKDDMIHQVMQSKTEQELREWVNSNYDFTLNGKTVNCNSFRVVYRKIKYLKAYGFVDWDFKNPNTIANKRKEKINEQQDEIKALREFKKNAERYFKYQLKIQKDNKLTKTQREWLFKYTEWLRKEYSE